MGKKNSGLLRLGITGGAGSGKSVVCRRLGRHGVGVIMADELARRAVMPGMPAYDEIVEYFGDAILAADGTIDRGRLRYIIVRDKAKKQALESFIHPEVFRLMKADEAALRQKGAAIVAIEVPLLFETGMEDYFDFILTVYLNRETQIQRLMARDQISRADAEALLRIQWPEKEKKKRSDFVIDNSGTLSQAEAAVDGLYKDLMTRLKNH